MISFMNCVNATKSNANVHTDTEHSQTMSKRCSGTRTIIVARSTLMSMEIMQTITTTKMIIPLMIVIAIIMTVVLYDNTCSDDDDNDDISENNHNNDPNQHHTTMIMK